MLTMDGSLAEEDGNITELPDEVVEWICGYMGFVELKLCRLLSRQWDKEVRKTLSKRDLLWLVFNAKPSKSAHPRAISFWSSEDTDLGLQMDLLGPVDPHMTQWSFTKFEVTVGDRLPRKIINLWSHWGKNINELRFLIDINFSQRAFCMFSRPEVTHPVVNIHRVLTEWCPSLQFFTFAFTHDTLNDQEHNYDSLERHHRLKSRCKVEQLKFGSPLLLKRLSVEVHNSEEFPMVKELFETYFANVVVACEGGLQILEMELGKRGLTNDNYDHLFRSIITNPNQTWLDTLGSLKIPGTIICSILKQGPLPLIQLQSLSMYFGPLPDDSVWAKNFTLSFPKLTRLECWWTSLGSSKTRAARMQHFIRSLAELPSLETLSMSAVSYVLNWVTGARGSSFLRNVNLNLFDTDVTLEQLATTAKLFHNVETLNLLNVSYTYQVRDDFGCWDVPLDYWSIISELSVLTKLRTLYINYPFNTTQELMVAMQAFSLLPGLSNLIMKKNDDKLSLGNHAPRHWCTLVDEEFKSVLDSDVVRGLKSVRLVNFNFWNSSDKLAVEEFVRQRKLRVAFDLPPCPCYVRPYDPWPCRGHRTSLSQSRISGLEWSIK